MLLVGDEAEGEGQALAALRTAAEPIEQAADPAAVGKHRRANLAFPQSIAVADDHRAHASFASVSQ